MPTYITDTERARTVGLLRVERSLFVWGSDFSYEFDMGEVLDAVAREASRTLTPLSEPEPEPTDCGLCLHSGQCVAGNNPSRPRELDDGVEPSILQESDLE